MGLLQKFEDSLDRVVNGAFAKAFKAEVQPVELASALQREVDDRASVLDRDRTVIPNVFHIELSHHDYTRLAVFKDALGSELATLVTNYAGEQHYTLLGQARVTMSEDDELETGIFRVRSEAKAEVTSKVGAVQPIAMQSEAQGAAPTPVGGGQPRLEVGGQAYPLVRAITVLGRGTDADIRVEDPGVSRKHCEIVVGTPALVRDLNSTNGTFLDGQKISESALQDGSVVKIGGTSLVYRSG